MHARTLSARRASVVRLGAHMSIAGGVDKAPLRGREAGCDTIQVFTKSNRQWAAKPLTDEQVRAYKDNLAATGIGPVVAHTCYLINLAAPSVSVWRRSVASFRDEMERAERLGIPYLVTHPGSHLGAGEAEGVARVAEALNALHAALPESALLVLLEATAGQGTSLGRRFEEIAAILERVEARERLGVCLDTCHLFAAGYDLRTPTGYAKTMGELAACVGLKRVKAIHLNDSKAGLGSRVDRHTHIGEGALGTGAFRLLLNDRRFRRVPMILETPKDGDGVAADRRNLARLRRLLGWPGEPTGKGGHPTHGVGPPTHGVGDPTSRVGRPATPSTRRGLR
ncbi:MAG: deoxyribonuclease IV [candidate division NC10 bacterium]|nr:deoxyribonuclease IV [candidate division NC10 bacterium]